MSNGIGSPEWEKRLQSVAEDLKSKGVKYIQAEVPDMDGMLRGKILSPKKGMSPTGAAWCVIHYCASVQDNLIEETKQAFASAPEGGSRYEEMPGDDGAIYEYPAEFAAAVLGFLG